MKYFRTVTLAASLLWTGVQSMAQAPDPAWPTATWAKATPEAQGFDMEAFGAFEKKVAAGDYGFIDRMIVIRNGRIIVDKPYSNDYREIGKSAKGALGCGVDACDGAADLHDFNYYHPDFHPFYQERAVHTLQSVTKSVTATLIGVALQRGEIAGLDVPILSFFEDYDLSKVDQRLRQATLDDLLTMRSGIEWHETDRPLDETNTTLQLERSQDWIQFTLDQPMDADPGVKWAYSSGGSHLMSGIIKKATGMYADEYATKYLFGPLGISDYYWKKTPRGYPDTEGGLYLEAEQLAKIGYLYLNDGVWEGKRLLPENWVEEATARRVQQVNNAGWGYGYQWWRLDRNDTDVWAGLGFGGQYLYVLPQYQVIGVVNSWNIFNIQTENILIPFIDAMIQSVAP